eukprot:scaffold721_cov131-Cylindrotheca_fusiformis.AAC.42
MSIPFEAIFFQRLHRLVRLDILTATNVRNTYTTIAGARARWHAPKHQLKLFGNGQPAALSKRGLLRCPSNGSKHIIIILVFVVKTTSSDRRLCMQRLIQRLMPNLDRKLKNENVRQGLNASDSELAEKLKKERQSINSEGGKEGREESPPSRMMSFDGVEKKKHSSQPWRIGSWRDRRSQSLKEDLANEEYRYHGGLMKEEPGPASGSRAAKVPRKSGIFRKKSTIPVGATSSFDADTVSNFSTSEWTPADSAYGAACPTSVTLTNERNANNVTESSDNDQMALDDDDLYAAYDDNGANDAANGAYNNGGRRWMVR